MHLDLRVPMGGMFSLTGLILTVFGLATNGNQKLYTPSLGINANLWWGLVLLVFGLSMFLFGLRGQKRLNSLPTEPTEEGSERRGH